jgi:antitoxin HicB
MLRQFVYPAAVQCDQEGYFLVTFPDFPEAGTDAKTMEEALSEASDCLAEAVAGRIVRHEDIPKASRKQRGQHMVALPAQMAAKAAIYLAMKETNVSVATLARLLHCEKREIQRLLNPKSPVDLQRIDDALAVIGQELVVSVQTSAAG